ncbi:MAG: hypothetical protein WCK11_03425 [Candidatus Falkowbacteria bacterium]
MNNGEIFSDHLFDDSQIATVAVVVDGSSIGLELQLHGFQPNISTGWGGGGQGGGDEGDYENRDGPKKLFLHFAASLWW